MWKPEQGSHIEQILRRIIKLLLNSGESSKSTNQIMGMLRSADNLTISSALVEGRNRGILACTDKQWYIRQRYLAYEFEEAQKRAE